MGSTVESGPIKARGGLIGPRWRRISMRTRLIGAFTLLVVLAFASALLALSRLERATGAYASVLSREHLTVFGATRFQWSAGRELSAGRRYVLTGAPQFLGERGEAALDGEAALAYLIEAGFTSAGLNLIVDARARLRLVVDRAISLRQQGQVEPAAALLLAEGEPAEVDLFAEVERLIDGEEARLAKVNTRVSREIGGLTNLVIAAWIAILIGGLAVALGFSFSVARASTRLVGHVRKIAAGDLSTPVVAGRHGEIGELAAGIDEMRLALARAADRQSQLLADVQHQAGQAVTFAEDLKSALTQERQAVARLEEIDRLKLDFVSMVSHELKSPLVGIHDYVTMLLHHGAQLDDAQRRELLDVVGRESLRLARLVDDVLVTSRLESSQVSYSLEPVYLLGLVEEVMIDRQAAAPDHRLAIDWSGSPPTVRADPARLRQVLINLLDNAVKYSPAESQVLISVEARPDEGEAHVHVRDHGIGIAAEDLPRLFGKFQRLSGPVAVIGTGLGLYISRMLIEGQGGKIWVESARGVGSTFSFSVPLDVAETPAG